MFHCIVTILASRDGSQVGLPVINPDSVDVVGSESIWGLVDRYVHVQFLELTNPNLLITEGVTLWRKVPFPLIQPLK